MAGGAVSLPTDTPTPIAAVGAADSPAAPSALNPPPAAPPTDPMPSDRPWPMSPPTVCKAWAELVCAR